MLSWEVLEILLLTEVFVYKNSHIQQPRDGDEQSYLDFALRFIVHIEFEYASPYNIFLNDEMYFYLHGPVKEHGCPNETLRIFKHFRRYTSNYEILVLV